MTTKTGEKLRGRKRDPEVMEKAWATRRRNKRKAARAAKANARGSKMLIRKGRRNGLTTLRSEAIEGLKLDVSGFLKDAAESMTTAIGVSEADGANQTDNLLIREFSAQIQKLQDEEPQWLFAGNIPRSVIEAILRRLAVRF